MSVTAQGTGTQAASIGTEHTVLDVAAAGTYTFHVDTVNMAAGDVVELRVYQIVLTGGTRRVVYMTRFSGAQPVDDMIKISVPVSNELLDAGSLRFTLKQTFGTGRSYPWKVLTYSATGAAVPAYPGALQNGVIASGDAALSGLSVSAGGQISFTLAAATPIYVLTAAGLLVALSYAGASYTPTPGTLPASGTTAIYGVEIDSTGTVSLVKGADSAAGNFAIASGSVTSPAVTSGSLRLADIAVANVAGTFQLASTNVSTQGTNWRDRRPWARGFRHRILRTSNASAGNNYTTTSGSSVAVDATNLQVRAECSGVPLRIRLAGLWSMSTSAQTVQIGFGIDGAAAGVTNGSYVNVSTPPAGSQTWLDFEYEITPAAGTHIFQPYYLATGGATATLYANASQPLIFEIDELLTPSANNGTS